MTEEIKNGKEMLDDFFETIKGDDNLDQIIVKKVAGLHNEGKLTKNNMTNMLSELRKGNCNDED
jgi:hypothetical protein